MLVGDATRRVEEIENDTIHLRDECEHAPVVVPDPPPHCGIVEIQAFLAVDGASVRFRIIPNIVECLVPHERLLYPLFMGISGEALDQLRPPDRTYVFELMYQVM